MRFYIRINTSSQFSQHKTEIEAVPNKIIGDKRQVDITPFIRRLSVVSLYRDAQQTMTIHIPCWRTYYAWTRGSIPMIPVYTS